MTRKIIGDGSHAAIKAATLGRPPISGEEVPSPLASSHRALPRVASSNRKMQRHERTGEPIYSNSPEAARPRGMRDHPVEHED
jgi:hypothetical protein